MKVSEITLSNIYEYCRVNSSELSVAEAALFQAYLDTAKAFLKSYTGIPLCEYVVTEDTEVVAGKTYYYIQNNVYVEFTGTVFVAGTTYYEKKYEDDIDNYEDFAIVVFILVEDMYDNRRLYVDKNNLNKVVETILGMHCKNLL